MSSRRAAAVVLGILFLVPASWAGLTALRLARASWDVAAAGGEPIISALVPPGELEAALERADELVPGDYRYPAALAQLARETARESGWTDPDLFSSWNQLLESARRAPTHAETRFHLSGIAFRQGNVDEADRQARAALRLAPLFRDLRNRVGRYFQARFQLTRTRRHLQLAISALRGEEEELAQLILEDPVLKEQEVIEAFTRARIPIESQLVYLGKAGRWEWAIARAASADRDAGNGSPREARVRIRLAQFLLEAGRRELGLRQVIAAHALDPEVEVGHLLLGRALLAAGRESEAVAALDRHLREDGDPDAAEEELRQDGVAAAWREGYWRRVIEEGRSGDAARLALARSILEGGRLDDGHRILSKLVRHRELGAEAAYVLARAHRESGDIRVALKYAEMAAERAPGQRKYAKLLRALRRSVK